MDAKYVTTLAPVLLSLFAAGAAEAARPVGPPIEELTADPVLIRIAAATAREKTSPGHVRFEIVARLSGEAPDEVLLRADPQTFEEVAVGGRYVVAWSYLRKNRLYREGYETDPEGPAIAKVRGLAIAALFEDTPALRYLFSPGVIQDQAQAARQLDALLEQMARADARSRSLVAMQLALRPDFSALLDQPRQARLKALLDRDDLLPQHREFLLQAALRVETELPGPWLAEEFRRIIIHHGARYDLSSFVPALVLAAARGLERTGNAADVELLSLLLYSNNPGVAKAALAAIDALDQAAAQAKVEQALARDWIHAETRRALRRYHEAPGAPAG